MKYFSFRKILKLSNKSYMLIQEKRFLSEYIEAIEKLTKEKLKTEYEYKIIPQIIKQQVFTIQDILKTSKDINTALKRISSIYGV